MAKTVTIPITDHDSNCTAYYLVQLGYNGIAGYFFTERQYTDEIVLNNLTSGTSYDLSVTRISCNQVSSTPALLTFTATTPPTPTTFNVTQAGADVNGTWDDMSVDSYEAQRATDVGFTTGLTDVYAGVPNAFADLTVPAGTYWYRVRSVEDGVSGAWVVDTITVT